MSADDWHMANAVQAAWRDGQQSVMDEERKRKEREAKQQSSMAKLKASR